MSNIVADDSRRHARFDLVFSKERPANRFPPQEASLPINPIILASVSQARLLPS